MIDGPATGLLRAHVADGSDDHARNRVVGRDRFITARRRPALFRQPEIEDLDSPVARDHDVGGLEIPVHDVGGVRRCEAIGNLDRHVEQRAHRDWASLDQRGQHLATHQFRGNVHPPSSVPPTS